MAEQIATQMRIGRGIGDRGASGFEDLLVELLDMTDRGREFLRCNGYIVVGLLAGLAIGIGVGPRVRDLVMNNGWPNDSISWVTISLIFVSIILNGFLYRGLNKGDHRKSVTNPSPQSES